MESREQAEAGKLSDCKIERKRTKNYKSEEMNCIFLEYKEHIK